MRTSLVTRLTVLVALVIAIAFVLLAVIVHKSTSSVYVETRNEVILNESISGSDHSRLIQSIEAAFDQGGWDEVDKVVLQYAMPPGELAIGDARSAEFVVFDEQHQVRSASGGLSNAKITPGEDGMFHFAVQTLSDNHSSKVELSTSNAPRLKTIDGSTFGRLIVLPRQVDPVVGENFASQVWRSAAVWLLLTIVVSMGITAILIRRSLKPIARLTEAASELQGGAFPAQLQVEGDAEFRQLIQAFNSATKSIADTDSLRRQLISDIAHELRTPLTNIIGQLEAAQTGLIKDSADLISTLQVESRLLERLVDDFQQLAISDAGQLRIRSQRLSVAELFQEILTPFVEQTSAHLEMEIPDELHIWADEERMRQVVGNLVENSARHNPSKLMIKVNAEQQNGFAKILFGDNGPGISVEDQPFIFDRFYRAEKSRNRSTGGSGLGLSIVQALIQAMDGTIRFVPSTKGALFEIRLPVDNRAGDCTV